MPRYFFNTQDGSRDCDDEGTELSDDGTARKHAIAYAGDVMRNEPDVLWDGRDFLVEVTNEDQVLLFTITCFATNAPAGGDTK